MLALTDFASLDRDHLNRILQICGTPDPELMAKIESAPVGNTHTHTHTCMHEHTHAHTHTHTHTHTHSQARQYVEDQPKYAKKDFQQFFVGASTMAVNLLTLLLTMDPDKRPTAEQALQHPYFSKYHMPKDEVHCITNSTYHMTIT